MILEGHSFLHFQKKIVWESSLVSADLGGPNWSSRDLDHYKSKKGGQNEAQKWSKSPLISASDGGRFNFE